MILYEALDGARFDDREDAATHNVALRNDYFGSAVTTGLVGDVVYFISTDAPDAPIKIGVTTSQLRTRLAGIQTGSPYRLTVIAWEPRTPYLESNLHARFAATRLVGEWFERSPELMAYIEEVRESSSEWTRQTPRRMPFPKQVAA